MATKLEIITELKTQYPTLKSGSDEFGYTEIIGAEYEAQIEDWADRRIAKEAKKAEQDAIKTQEALDKTALLAKLAALGLTTDDLKALGLGTN